MCNTVFHLIDICSNVKVVFLMPDCHHHAYHPNYCTLIRPCNYLQTVALDLCSCPINFVDASVNELDIRWCLNVVEINGGSYMYNIIHVCGVTSRVALLPRPTPPHPTLPALPRRTPPYPALPALPRPTPPYTALPRPTLQPRVDIEKLTPSSLSSRANFDWPVDFRFSRKAEPSLLLTSAILANL